MTDKIIASLIAIALSLPLSGTAWAQSYAASYNLEPLVEGLDAPWGLAILPDGDMLVTELTGNLRHIRNGNVNDKSSFVSSLEKEIL